MSWIKQTSESRVGRGQPRTALSPKRWLTLATAFASIHFVLAIDVCRADEPWLWTEKIDTNANRPDRFFRSARGAACFAIAVTFSPDGRPKTRAETVPGPSTEAFGRLARELGIYLTVPVLEVDAKGSYFNTVGANWAIPHNAKVDWHGWGHTRIIDRNGRVAAKTRQDRGDRGEEEMVLALLPIPD